MPRLAVVMTCHNRRDVTLACLAALARQDLPAGVHFDVYLTDDGSSDGTAEAVRARYPEVIILPGAGDLYWCGGMRLAYGRAMQRGYDYYLWLNDDTVLDGDALERLLRTSETARSVSSGAVVVVGTARDALTGQATYGGVERPSRLARLRFRLVSPGSEPVTCESMNGNCVLIPDDVARAVGNLDEAFTHGIADFDYGLRIRAQGYQLLVMPGYAGICGKNPATGNYNDRSLPLAQRLGQLTQPKGLPPAEWKVFCRRYAGVLWPVYYAWPRLKLVATWCCRRK